MQLSKIRLNENKEQIIINRILSDESIDFTKENSLPLETLMAYYRCVIMEIEQNSVYLTNSFHFSTTETLLNQLKHVLKAGKVYSGK